MTQWMKRIAVALAVVALIAAGSVAWLSREISKSLPQLEGRIDIDGLASAVTIERDALGVPTVRASDRRDIGRALGFLHAQERFFQMDLLRRRAAGELSELFGAAALDADRAARIHRFRWRARERVHELTDTEREILAAYSGGVNQGLDQLRAKPFEYLLLRADPAPWRDEDSVLALFAMYFVLNDAKGNRESDLGLLRDVLPEDLADFIAPLGTEWDAPIVGEAFETLPIPSDASPFSGLVAASNDGSQSAEIEADSLVGSNNWAVGGSRTADGRAILANDMHLGMAVPNTWYRVVLEWPANDGCGEAHRMVGVTLPGSPALVAGSNTRVAWGFTNSQGDWSDLVMIELDPSDPASYRTADGWRQIDNHTETIAVRNGDPEIMEIRETIWGPIVGRDHRDRPRAIRWIAHDPGGANLGLLQLEHVTTVGEAIEVANSTGIPPQNFVCADRHGSIGWTIIGRIPNRVGFSGRYPTSWADGERGWDGWLEPESYPRVVDPPAAIIWTANARVVGGEMLEIVGEGGYDLGARASQIRDDLLALEAADEADMLAVQLDDRALFLERWRRFMLELLDEEAVDGEPKRQEFRALVEGDWSGRASVDSVGFRLVRAFRTFTFERVYGWLTAPCETVDEGFNIYRIQQAEGPLWRMINEQPPHLLHPDAGSWPAVLLEIVDSTIDYYETEIGGGLAEMNWGSRNTLAMRHPLSRAVPVLSRWLDLPRIQLPGDSDMPRVQSPGWGASERLAVSPGREEDGYFHMPAGQSGHFRSPYYGAGHDAWAAGLQTPLLPGATEWVLTLAPLTE
jgi:penicillin amidase